MKALFICGTGIISSACTRLAVARGIDLYVLNRGRSSRAIPDGATRLTADIRDPESVRTAIGAMGFDADPSRQRVDHDLDRTMDRIISDWRQNFTR